MIKLSLTNEISLVIYNAEPTWQFMSFNLEDDNFLKM